MRKLMTMCAAAAALCGPAVALAQVDENEPSPYAPKPASPFGADMMEAEQAELAAEAVPPVDQTAKRFGVGAGQTIGGIRGAEVEIYPIPRLMLDGHLAIWQFSPESGDSQTVIAAAVGAFYRWKVHDNVALMMGGRLAWGHRGGSSEYNPEDPYGYSEGGATQVNLEAPLRAEVYFAERLSIHGEVGAVLAFIGEGGGVLGESWYGTPQGTYLVAGGTDLLGTLGFTLYLD